MLLPYSFQLRPRPWLAFLLLVAWLTGCRSEKVAFEFSPAQAVAARDSGTAAAPRPAATLAPLAAPAPAQPAVVASVPPGSQARGRRPAAARLAQKALVPILLRQALRQPQAHRRAAAPAETAEVGLGSLFILLVVIVLAVLSGLAAAIAAIFSIGFWAALGIMGLVLLAALLLLGGLGMLRK
jgi:hypothetical protein